MEACKGILGIMLLVLFGSSINAQINCPNNWRSYVTQGGAPTCLWLSREKTSWPNAYQWCKIMGGQLVEINSLQMNFKVSLLIQGQQTGKYWIGLTDMESENVYKWVSTNVTPMFEAFQPGKSLSGVAKNCVHTDEKGLWAVESCKAEFWFVCQKQATPTIVG